MEILAAVGRRVRAGRVVLRLLRPLWVPAALVLGLSFAMLDAQTRDVLSHQRSLGLFARGNLCSLAGAIVFGLSAWYFPRALLYVRFRTTPADPGARLLPWRRVVPRLLGVLPLLSLSLACALEGLGSLVVQYALAALLLFAFFVGRRRMLRRGVPWDDRLPVHSFRMFVLCATLSLALLALFLASPVRAPQAVGPVAVILFSASGVLAFSSILLVYPTYRFDLPSLAVLALFASFVFSVWNGHHEVRLLPEPEKPSKSTNVDDAFTAWMAAREIAPTDAAYPVFLVAAEGGGIRAAYWTASVLAYFEDTYPGFSEHVFAMSGVSGGSLGLSVFAALLADRMAAGDDARPLLPDTREILGRDFLAPVLAGLLTADLTQSFLPVGLLPDRGTSLELAFEDSFQRTRGTDRFSKPMLALWERDAAFLPSLLLNATSVESGDRLLLSNLDTEGPILADGAGRFEERLRLSSAVHCGARFTYVSPVGVVPSGVLRDAKGAPRVEQRIVDGGYFENSGTQTLAELLACLQRHPQAGRAEFFVLILVNDPMHLTEAGSAAEQEPTDRLVQVAGPVRALLHTRVARGRLAERALVELAGEGHSFKLPLPLLGTRAAPLGWMLSHTTRRRIDQVVDEDLDRTAMEMLVRESEEPLAEETPQVEQALREVQQAQTSLERFRDVLGRRPPPRRTLEGRRFPDPRPDGR